MLLGPGIVSFPNTMAAPFMDHYAITGVRRLDQAMYPKALEIPGNFIFSSE